MKLGQQLGMLLDSSLHHFKKHGLLLMGIAMLLAVSKWTITYLLSSFNVAGAGPTLISLLAVIALLVMVMTCQAGLMLQADALTSQQWLTMRQALGHGLAKVCKIIAAFILVFVTFGGALFLLSYGLGLLISGPISGGLATTLVLAFVIYGVLRLSYLLPAIVLGEHSIFASIKTTLELTNSFRKITFTLIGLTMATVLISALISVPWLLLWGISWGALGAQLATVIVEQTTGGLFFSGFITLCGMLIEAWSIPIFFLIIVAMYHELEDDLGATQ